MKLFKYDIRFNTFLKKGVKPLNDNFFIAMICGAQGTGKNTWALMLVLDSNKKIYTNIRSMNIPNREIIYFTRIEEIYSYDDDNSIFIIDECSKKWFKESKQDKAFYSWLMQSRKHRREVYTIWQEYLQTPSWVRGVANKVYTTHKTFFGLCVTSLGTPVLTEDTKEWTTINHKYIIYKRTAKLCSYYDTFERINSL